MNARAGSAVAWASYDLPVSINDPSGFNAQFSYAPDRSRWRQVASYSNGTETTIYIAGLLEKLITNSSGRTHWKHLISTPSGQIQVIRRSDMTSDILYFATDHLGSVDVVTNGAASVVARLSYTVHGARRNSTTWIGAPTSAQWLDIANTTRRGFTGHEHLDNVSLVHMNGRVFDPQIGRFISADPFVDGFATAQGWNRYSYTRNNLLGSVDPSGFDNVEVAVTVEGRRPRSSPGFGIMGGVGTGMNAEPKEPIPVELEVVVEATRLRNHLSAPMIVVVQGTQETKCYAPFSGGDSFASQYAARVGNLVAGLLDSFSGGIDLGPQISGTVNFFGIKPSFAAGVFNGKLSLTGAGNLTLSVRSPMPGNLAYGEVSLSAGAWKVGAASSSVTEGISTRSGSFQQVNEGFSGMAKATAWKSDVGKVGAHFQVGVGAKLEWDAGAALRALGCATSP